MESSSKVSEVLVSGVWESLDDGESIREEDPLGVNSLHAFHKNTGCCSQCFCFSLVVGGVLSSWDTTVNVPPLFSLMNMPSLPFLVVSSAELLV